MRSGQGGVTARSSSRGHARRASHGRPRHLQDRRGHPPRARVQRPRRTRLLLLDLELRPLRTDALRAVPDHAAQRIRRSAPGVLLVGRLHRGRPLELASARREPIRPPGPPQRVGPLHEAGRLLARRRVGASRAVLAATHPGRGLAAGHAPHPEADARMGRLRGGACRRGPRGSRPGHAGGGGRPSPAPRHEGCRARAGELLRRRRRGPALRLARRPRRLAPPCRGREGDGGPCRFRRSGPSRLHPRPRPAAVVPGSPRGPGARALRAAEGRRLRLLPALARRPGSPRSVRGDDGRPARGPGRAGGPRVRGGPERGTRGQPGIGPAGLPGSSAGDASPADRTPLERRRRPMDPARARGALRGMAGRLPLPRSRRCRAPADRRVRPGPGPLVRARGDPDRRSRDPARNADVASRGTFSRTWTAPCGSAIEPPGPRRTARRRCG